MTDADAGRVVYFASGSTALTGDIRKGKGAHAIALSDDGSIASVTNEDEDTVTMIGAASHSIVKTVKVGVKPNHILFRRRTPKPMKI